MALFKSKETHKVWGIHDFPQEVKSVFKAKCKEGKKNMIDVLRGLLRNYVNETSEMLNTKKFKKVEQNQKSNYYDLRHWYFRSFPIKLLADFKSACMLRDNLVIDAIIHLIKEHNEKEHSEVA